MTELRRDLHKRLDAGSGGALDRRRTDVEARVEENLCRSLCVLLLDVSEQDMLACTDQPHDGLTDRTCSDAYDHICQINPHCPLCCGCFATKAFIALMSST